MPLDVVKSRLQADRREMHALQLVRSIYEREGLTGFYKGLLPTIIRGFLVNAIILSVYSQTLAALQAHSIPLELKARDPD